MPNRSRCERFVAFHMDPSVCDSCGALAEQHAPSARTTPERVKSLWRTMLRLGGVPDYYAGESGYAYSTDTVRAHVSTCGIDWEKVNEPSMDWQMEFAGTDCDSGRYEALSGHLYCVCGEVRYEPWTVHHLTMGQLIWHAVREGDYPESD